MNNKVVLMCGSHMRHLYVAEKLYNEGRLAALVIEEREQFVPQPPSNLPERDKKNFIEHFKKRDEKEKYYFDNINNSAEKDVSTLRISKEELNSSKTIEFIKKAKADILITYGVHMVTDEVIECYKDKAFNIHGGLSPWYRGNTTLFWPFYFLKPNYAGMTIHRLTQKLDGGDILHHSVPTLEYGDTMHDVACKAVIKVVEDLCEILRLLDDGCEIVCNCQKSAGKLFLTRDWTPQTLRVIYELFEDKIVDMYLNGELQKDEPVLVDFINNKNK